METIATDLKSLLNRQRTTSALFNLPFSCDNIEIMLRMAVEAEVESLGGKFMENDEMNRQIAAVARWAAGQSGKPGLFLAGRCGNGKTTMVRALQRLVNSLHDYSSQYRDIPRVSLYNAMTLTRIYRLNPNEWDNAVWKPVLAVDDMGSEPSVVMDYGNAVHPVVYLLSDRYDRRLPTIVTSNLIPSDVSEIYGERIADRMKEMMDVVVFRNESFRR